MRYFSLFLIFITTSLAQELSEEFTIIKERTTDQIVINEPKGKVSAFFASYSSIFVSEIGDKTFFLAAIMSMRYNKMYVFLGAGGALVLMTFISCAFGAVVPTLFSPKFTQILAMILFFAFGIKLIYEWRTSEENEENNELKEVEQEMQELHKKLVSQNSHQEEELEQQQQNPTERQKNKQIPLKIIAWQAFYLTFISEWGDRSQFSTIALAAIHPSWLVFVGGSLGHLTCTVLAIQFGQLISEKISERNVNLVGGILFTLFGFLQLKTIIFGE